MKILKIIISKKNQTYIVKHTPLKALSIFVEGNFTRKQWEIIQCANKNIYPCNSLIQKEKKNAIQMKSLF